MASICGRMPPLSIHPIPCPPVDINFTELLNNFNTRLDADVYGGFGKNLTLEQYRWYLTDKGHRWTGALHHQILASEKFIRSNIGQGYTRQEVIEKYKMSLIGYPCTEAFLKAFSRCEIDYLHPEIQHLRSQQQLSLPKALDYMKGGKTKEKYFKYDTELAKGRLGANPSGRLLAADVSAHCLRHRLEAYARIHNLPESGLWSDRSWESEKDFITPFTRGFLRDLEKTNNHGNSEWRRLNAAFVPEEMFQEGRPISCMLTETIPNNHIVATHPAHTQHTQYQHIPSSSTFGSLYPPEYMMPRPIADSKIHSFPPASALHDRDSKASSSRVLSATIDKGVSPFPNQSSKKRPRSAGLEELILENTRLKDELSRLKAGTSGLIKVKEQWIKRNNETMVDLTECFRDSQVDDSTSVILEQPRLEPSAQQDQNSTALAIALGTIETSDWEQKTPWLVGCPKQTPRPT